MSISAYKRSIRSSETPRDIERQIFSRITSALHAHAAHYDENDDRYTRLQILAGPLQMALAENSRLWGALKSDLGRPGNALGAELRAQLISLALYVERETRAILIGDGSVSALVTVNRSIIDGLAGISPNSTAA